MTLLPSKCSTKSPIGTVPYDVLVEIFIHCLPRDRFGSAYRRCKTTVAPMLLCHVCASWRTVALATRTLWTHMSYFLKADHVAEDRGLKLLANKIEFIQWWKKNQGSIAPFLELVILIHGDDPVISSPRFKETFACVMNYVTTAQYLQLGSLSMQQVKAMAALGDNDTYPNLYTLVTDDWSAPIDYHFRHTSSALRRLAILDQRDDFLSTTSLPPQWSTTLTHLSITNTIPLDFRFWVTLTTAVPCLQWAYISFEVLVDIDHDTTVERTLQQLSSLFIIIKCTGYEKIGPLFKGLHLPALTDLVLATIFSEWWDLVGMEDIYTVLESTPALRHLTLQKPGLLESSEMDYAFAEGIYNGNDDIEPIWSSVPHLVHLQLELHISFDGSETEVERALDEFAARGFISSDNLWLDLDNPECPIERITVIDHGSDYFLSRQSSYGYHSDDTTQSQPKASIIRECDTNTYVIPLHLISQPFTDFGVTWKEWRSGN